MDVCYSLWRSAKETVWIRTSTRGRGVGPRWHPPGWGWVVLSVRLAYLCHRASLWFWVCAWSAHVVKPLSLLYSLPYICPLTSYEFLRYVLWWRLTHRIWASGSLGWVLLVDGSLSGGNISAQSSTQLLSLCPSCASALDHSLEFCADQSLILMFNLGRVWESGCLGPTPDDVTT